MAQATGELLDAAGEAALEAAMAPLEDLTDVLTGSLTVGQLAATLAANGVDERALQLGSNSIDMALIVADGLLHGLPPDCPVCASPGLVTCAGRVTCWSVLSASSGA